MSGHTSKSPLKHEALMAFDRGDEGATPLLAQALGDNPYDGDLLIAHAAAAFREGADGARPSDRGV
ncbi:MAG: hypothetical protein ABJK59_11785 [Erythrobacter sp.]|uniref:hypothetical protein n=1 Tax=Erythrobacter sp. TaxID=1042 RepID=UPI0032993C12